MDNSPEVLEQNGVPVVSSLKVAEHFGKRHTHVLRAIDKLIADCPPEFTEPNFGLSEYTDSTGRTLPYYLLTRDAFSLLVMGFTGKEALAWKIRYIEAFNAMEKALIEQEKDSAKTYLLAGALSVLLSRETPIRRELVKEAMYHASADWSGIRSAALLGVSPSVIYRIRRKYAAFAKGYSWLVELGRLYLPSLEESARQKRLVDLGRALIEGEVRHAAH